MVPTDCALVWTTMVTVAEPPTGMSRRLASSVGPCPAAESCLE